MVTCEIEPVFDVLNDPDFKALSEAYARAGVEDLVGDDWVVDEERYGDLNANGLFDTFALRADGKLVGFSTLAVSVSLHTSRAIALVESIFVAEGYRPYSGLLIASMRRYAREKGIRYLSFSAPAGSSLDRMLSVQAKRGRAKHVYNVYIAGTDDASRFNN